MKNNIREIIDNNLCVSCGACVQTCGEKNLKIVFNKKKGVYEPKALNSHIYDECDCLDICPSFFVDYNELSAERFGKRPDSPVGIVDKVFLAQNKNKEINLKASSGGVIKAVLTHLFQKGEIDAVISVRHKEKLAYEPTLITNVNEVSKLPGSIYHNIDFSKTYDLLREAKGKIAIVATPCQLDGLFLYLRKYEKNLSEKIKFTIGLMCGWTYSHHSLKAICEYKNINFEKIKNVSYRGNGPVGKLTIETEDGTVKKINRRIDLHYSAAFDRSFNLLRCHYCVNHGNYLADLVVGDAWLPCTVKTKTGISLVISRTGKATKYLTELEEENKLTLVETSEDDVIESQTARVVFGSFSYSLAKLKKKRGEFAPEFTGPNEKFAKVVADAELVKFLNRLEIKRGMQEAGQYKKLLFYKYTHEIKPFLYRYIRWFLVRILKIKSLVGIRKEKSLKELGQFL